MVHYAGGNNNPKASISEVVMSKFMKEREIKRETGWKTVWRHTACTIEK
jgi:hypothetical protein